jgi:tetratricopeptide (TPR) repeat protein
MELIGLTKAVALTTLTFTLSATPTWGQTNQNSFTCSSTSYPGCVEQIPTPLGLTREPGKYQKINAGESLPPTVQISYSEALTIKNSEVVSQRPPILYSQSQSNRDLAETYFDRGIVYYEQGNLALALFNLNRAIELNPNYADAYINRGVVYANQQKWDLALADFTQAITFNPNFAEAYYNRGNVYEDQQKWDLALADFTQAITFNPNFAEAYNNRGLVYYKQQKWDLALVDFNKGIAINPNDAEAYNNRGIVYRQLGDINKARGDLQKAAQLYRNQGDTAAYQRTLRILNSL